MPKNLLIAALAVLALALPASALADPGVIDHVTQGPAGGNANVQNDQGRISDDGRCVAFETTEKLTDDDVNNRRDIYERCGSTTTLVSTGPAANAGTAPTPYLEYRSMSADGSCVLFDTNEVLTDGDSDSNIDIFKRCGSDIQRVSQGPQGGNAAQDVHHGTMSADGVCVVFQAHEALTDDDHDTIPDLFERCGSTTKRVSQGPAGGDDPSGFPQLEQVSADGSCVVFTTSEKLTGDDTDDQRDAYARCGATTRKLSPGNGAFDVSPDQLSPDGQCLVFETDEPLASTDTDTQNDIYTACSNGSLRHDSAGPTGGGGDFYVSGNEVSSDGSCVVFSTDEALTADDTDTATDVYRRCGEDITRVSTGPGGGNAQIDAEEDYVSADGRCVLFTSAEHITPDDSDASDDLFERCGSDTERVSQGPVGGNGSFAPTAYALSSDGTRVVFTTDEKLTADDDNAVTDVYEHSNGQTTKVSPAQTSDNTYGSNPQGASLDASRVMFSRFDRLTADDTDDNFDLYVATLAPTAANGDATDVTTTGATLHGTSSGDPAAKFHFVVEGSSTPEGDVPAGAGIKQVSAALTGLAPDTTYRYKLIVTSAGGTTTTSERSFRTSAAPVPGTDNRGNDVGPSDGGGKVDPPPVNPAFAGVVVRGGTVKVKRGVASVRVTCPAAAQGPCAGKLTLKAGRRTIGTKGFNIKPGKTANVRVRINRSGSKLLKRQRKLKVSAVAVARDARGASVRTAAKLTLKR
jgi:Tol biopolymer transport system component